jgi:hypothetical protein
VAGQPSITFDFDFDGNAQGGRTPGVDAPITVVAGGLDVAGFTKATGVITRSTTNVISLIGPLERNYENA